MKSPLCVLTFLGRSMHKCTDNSCFNIATKAQRTGKAVNPSLIHPQILALDSGVVTHSKAQKFAILTVMEVYQSQCTADCLREK